MKNLTVQIYGTRGSLPVAGKEFKKTGGNTTCLRIKSQCLPAGTALVVDSGSGFLACSQELLREEISNLMLFYTHWHYDHMMGIMLAPHTFNPNSYLEIFGPRANNMNILKIFKQLISPPFFPVDFEKLRYRFRYHDFKTIGMQVVAIHPLGGATVLKYSDFERTIAKNLQVAFPDKKYYAINECLVIKMYKALHPEQTISYRFWEIPTGKTFVFLTDHENTDSIPLDLLHHLRDADLLIEDCQYSEKDHHAKAGFGHGSPHYCVDLAAAAKIKSLGLTHHDPSSRDRDVESILQEAVAYARKIRQPGLADKIFSCRDFMVITL